MKLFSFLGFAIISQYIFWTQTFSSSISPYNAIFSFGDSISDTGNLLISGSSLAQKVGKLPYGETFFGHPTGRFSDGRLIIDFLAEAFGMPYLPPYLALTQGSSQNYRHGVNFAVAGATALDQTIMPNLWTNDSLNVQLCWFKKIKPSLCASKQGCKRFMKKSLFFVEIGGNDYGHLFSAGETIKQVEALIPLVVETITNAIITLIEEGATELVVPGIFSARSSAINAISELHNSKLKCSLETLRRKYAHARIIYADFYGATMQFFLSPEHYGFHKETIFMACCGGGGQHNYNPLVKCGSNGSTVCTDPSSYAYWDGIHFTEAAYRIISEGLLNGHFTTPPLIP